MGYRISEDATIIYPALSVRIVKRTIDIAFGLVGLTVCAVLHPFIALAIRLESPGPILYRQTRVGRNDRMRDRRTENKKIVYISERRKSGTDRRTNEICGKPMSLFKVRTMRQDAEKNGPQLCAIQGDPRVTRVGTWLRYFHLDELPQCWNLVKGDMSLIGPRPERPFFTEKYLKEIPYYEERMRFIKPGLTGLAQITLGYDESLQSVNYKYYYDVTYRLSMSSFASWARMELWVFFNTFRYLGNQLRFMKLHTPVEANAGVMVDKSSSIHIAHPWKLIQRMSAKKEVPEFLEGFQSIPDGASV